MLKRERAQQEEYMEKAADDDILVPEGMTKEQTEDFRQIFVSLGRQNSHEALTEVLMNNPELKQQYMQKHRELAIRRVGRALADCPMIQDLPIDILTRLLNGDRDEVSDLKSAMDLLKEQHVIITPNEVQAALDHAKVLEVMEPEVNEMDDYAADDSVKGPIDINRKVPWKNARLPTKKPARRFSK